MRSFKIGERFGDWILAKQLGKGGNGIVFEARNGKQVGAIKILTANKHDSKRAARFRDEVSAMRRCHDIEGVIPVLDVCPDSDETNPLWFVMGLASPLKKELGEAALEEVVKSIQDIANILVAMHERGVSHRDIKPENLFRFNGRWAIGDFGLADFDGKDAVTADGERLGPVYYIAPEMLNNAAASNGMPADVFSLAKTLWVFSTGQNCPLPGVYEPTTRAFQIGAYVRVERTHALDRLIAACSVVEPQLRPSMKQFVAELRAWLTPPTIPNTPISLDMPAIAALLADRKAADSSVRSRQRQDDAIREKAGKRVKTALLPMAQEIHATLKAHHFDPVYTNSGNFQHGLLLEAVIPPVSGHDHRLTLSIHICPTLPNIELHCKLESRCGGSAAAKQIWHQVTYFLEGGSEEPAALQRLVDSIKAELQGAVIETVNLATSHDRSGSI